MTEHTARTRGQTAAEDSKEEGSAAVHSGSGSGTAERVVEWMEGGGTSDALTSPKADSVLLLTTRHLYLIRLSTSKPRWRMKLHLFRAGEEEEEDEDGDGDGVVEYDDNGAAAAQDPKKKKKTKQATREYAADGPTAKTATSAAAKMAKKGGDGGDFPLVEPVTAQHGSQVGPGADAIDTGTADEVNDVYGRSGSTPVVAMEEPAAADEQGGGGGAGVAVVKYRAPALKALTKLQQAVPAMRVTSDGAVLSIIGPGGKGHCLLLDDLQAAGIADCAITAAMLQNSNGRAEVRTLEQMRTGGLKAAARRLQELRRQREAARLNAQIETEAIAASKSLRVSGALTSNSPAKRAGGKAQAARADEDVSPTQASGADGGADFGAARPPVAEILAVGVVQYDRDIMLPVPASVPGGTREDGTYLLLLQTEEKVYSGAEPSPVSSGASTPGTVTPTADDLKSFHFPVPGVFGLMHVGLGDLDQGGVGAAAGRSKRPDHPTRQRRASDIAADAAGSHTSLEASLKDTRVLALRRTFAHFEYVLGSYIAMYSRVRVSHTSFP